MQISLHDQGCVIFELSQFMQFCSAYIYPAFGGHSRLFSRQEEKATVDLLSSRLDGSLLRHRFTFLFLARQTGAFPFPLLLSYDKVLYGLYDGTGTEPPHFVLSLYSSRIHCPGQTEATLGCAGWLAWVEPQKARHQYVCFRLCLSKLCRP